jgi:hypothetical protein
VVRRVEVRAGVLPRVDVVPVPGRSAVVVAAELLELEARGLGELGRELDDRGVRRQRRGEVHDLYATSGQRVGEALQDRHSGPFSTGAVDVRSIIHAVGVREAHIAGPAGTSPSSGSRLASPRMRAVQITRFGGPEVLDVVDLPDPTPGEGEQLFDVCAAGINFADTHHCLS